MTTLRQKTKRPPTHQPLVPDHIKMRELTLRAVLLGLVMTVALGAANAYLGLRAGQTVAATIPRQPSASQYKARAALGISRSKQLTNDLFCKGRWRLFLVAR
jgi:hypothetical protein